MLKKIIFALIITVLPFCVDPALARNDCYAWGQARPIIAQEGLLAARDVAAMVQKRFGGNLLSAKLCERRGRYVYDITVLRDGGQVTEVTVNGRNGAHIRTVGGGAAAAASAAGQPKFKKPKKFKWKLPKIWKKKDR